MAVPKILQYGRFTILNKQKESYGSVNPTRQWYPQHFKPLYAWLVTSHDKALPCFMCNIKRKLLVGQYLEANTKMFSFNQSVMLVYIDVLQHRRKNSVEIIWCQRTSIFLYVTVFTVKKKNTSTLLHIQFYMFQKRICFLSDNFTISPHTVSRPHDFLQLYGIAQNLETLKCSQQYNGW